ncbi:MAG: hypothetical protein BroJett033_0240 [Chloroflexota bacterium]|nr:MAG: hypothetical protein BroJett033_0240 [Chloroflexota bacterium]
MTHSTAANGSHPQAELVHQLCRYIDANLEERLTLADLGAHAGLSPYHLQRVFKRVLGITPRQYTQARRLEAFKAHVRGGGTVTAALYNAGYGSSSRLYENANEQLGMTPATYGKGGEGMRIHYTIVSCPLGNLLVAATRRGVCAVSLGDTPAYLEAELRADYPAAEIARDDTDLGEWVAALTAYLEGQEPRLDLPLDVQATAFQWRVWQALRAIPAGETRTYGEIARSIGSPQAARAVGSACANNPVALIIPCHRAVRGDGSLGGYRWGLARKESLLEQEAASR